MDPLGMAADADSVATAASCVHAVRDYITITATELAKNQFPLCDMNPKNGVLHSVTTASNTFANCRNCHMIICANCDMTKQAFMLFVTSSSIFSIVFNIFTTVSNIKKYFLSVFVKYRSVTPYIFIGLCSLFISSFILFFSFDFSVISCDAPRAWGLYFQDSASPQMEALVELHEFLCIRIKLRGRPKALTTKDIKSIFIWLNE